MIALDFKDFLVKFGFDPSKVMVMRHCPTELALRRVLPWLAAEQPAVYNAYQSIQNPDAERALKKAEFVASLIAEDSVALFVGIYRRGGFRTITDSEFWAIPEIAKLRPYGINGISPKRDSALWFDLDLIDDLSDLKGRLVVTWPAGRLWWRWAKMNDFPVSAIHEDSVLGSCPPEWCRSCG
jgi:hypothetical protein